MFEHKRNLVMRGIDRYNKTDTLYQTVITAGVYAFKDVSRQTLNSERVPAPLTVFDDQFPGHHDSFREVILNRHSAY